MKKLQHEPMPLPVMAARADNDAYSRRQYKLRLVSHLRRRTVALGPRVQVCFEDGWTVQAPRTTAPSVCPGPFLNAWVATLTLAAAAPGAAAWRELCHDIAFSLRLEIGQHPRVAATAVSPLPLPRSGDAMQTQPLLFNLPGPVLDALRAPGGVPAMRLVCAHPGYWWRRVLPEATLHALLADVRGP